MAGTQVTIHPNARQRASHRAQAGDLDGVYVDVTSKGPGVQVRVDHNLRRVPWAAMFVNCPGECLFDRGGLKSPVAVAAWTDGEAYFAPMTPAGTVHRFLLV